MSEKLSLQAQETRRDYKRRYRAKNREKINRQQREWRADNGDKVRQYNRQYWERRAQRENARASYADYGITPQRLEDLMMIVRTGKYDQLVQSAAHAANESIAEYILLSVKENKSYDASEKLWARGDIERIPYGKTDFYGARRLFFYYLDCALKERQETENNIPIKEKKG